MRYYVYDPKGELVAKCLHAEDAAALISFYGDKATIYHKCGRLLWHEGTEDAPAHDSYDHVADVCDQREKAIGNPR